MTITRSATEIWLIGNRKCGLNICCLLTNGELVMSCVTFFIFSKIKMPQTNDAVKRTIEAVTEKWLKSRIPMKSSWFHSKQLLKIKMPQTNDAVKRTVEAVTEKWLKSRIPMKSTVYTRV